MEWDAIPYEQIVWGEKLGAGSFGVVMKGASPALPRLLCPLPRLAPCLPPPPASAADSLASSVRAGTYLGIDVAIKEVLPSTDYEVAKYFEREWRIMREARHPNVVQVRACARRPLFCHGTLALTPVDARVSAAFSTSVCRARRRRTDASCRSPLCFLRTHPTRR